MLARVLSVVCALSAVPAVATGVGRRPSPPTPDAVLGAMVLGAVPLAIATGAAAESRSQIGW